jgi:aspartyl-tRNA(Asn)/glutamyl-tRNA(Gln) amidotransferase subunit A
MSMYLADLCTIPASLAGIPAMSVPSGLASDDNMPVGLQIMAPALEDHRMYRVAAAYEVARDAADGGALINRIPDLEGMAR